MSPEQYAILGYAVSIFLLGGYAVSLLLKSVAVRFRLESRRRVCPQCGGNLQAGGLDGPCPACGWRREAD